MNETQIFILSVLGFYFAIMIAIGFYSSRKESTEGYIIGDRNVGYFQTMTSLAANFRDGAGIVFWVGAGLTMGYGGLWMAYGIILGLLFYSFAGPKIRIIAQDRNYITIGQVIQDNIGPLTRKLTAFVILAFTMMLIAMQLYVSGNVISHILNIDAWIGICSVAAVVGCYLYWGGYGNVIKTDAYQCLIMLSLLAIPFFLPPAKTHILNFSSLFSLSFKDSLAFFLVGFCYMFSCADAWQRVFSARDGKVIRYAFPASGLIFLALTLSLIFLGFGARQILPASTQANDVFFALFQNNVISAPLQSFIAVVAMAITMSTLSSGSYLSASTICKDVLSETITRDSRKYIKLVRIIMILILACMSLIAITIGDIVKFLFDAASLLFVISPIYTLAVLDRLDSPLRQRDLYLAGATFISLVCYIYFFATGAFSNMIVMFVPTAMNSVLSLIIYMVFRKKLESRPKFTDSPQQNSSAWRGRGP